MVGRRPITDLPKVAEFGCSEENESDSGGYPEVIYSVRGMKIGPEAQMGGRPAFGHGSRGVLAEGPHTPAPRRG